MEIKELEKLTKQELIEKIIELKNMETTTGKYGLVWDKEKEPEKIVVECDKMLPILENNLDFNLDSDDEKNNILIEGDNFHALTVLNYTHKEKIDVIYIDPPYNTGADDFIYNDRYVNIEDGYRHSKWLNFMNKRLRLAKELLKPTGVIFISIDTNEFAQLKLLCDQIFDEKAFVTAIHVEMSATQGMKVKAAKSGNVVKNGEFILIYRKNGQNNIGIKQLLDPVKYDSHYNLYLEDKGEYFEEIRLTDKIAQNEEIIKELEILEILDKNKKLSNNNIEKAYEKSIKFREWTNSNAERICRAHDSVDVPDEIKEKYVEGKIYEYESKSRKYLVCKNENGSISQRILLSDKLAIADDFYSTYGPTRIRGDWWPGFYLDMGNVAKEGNVEFKNGKKPVRLIKQLLKLSSKENDIILDFFAGSGTTGHAVIELNKEDKGKRKFILCTNNENNICREKTYKRLENVINQKGKNSTNLKYYKTEFIENTNNRDQLYFDLTEKCIPMLCMKEDTFEEVEKTEEYMIYKNKTGNKYSCVYFDIFGIRYEEFINKLETIEEKKKIYIFSLGNSIDEEPLKNVKDYKIEPIPYKIVELYRRLAKSSKEE